MLGVLAFASTAAAAPRIVYHSGNSPAGRWAMGVDGSSPTPFLANANGADFSGDGTKFVYQVGGSVACNVNFGFGQIVVANADGSSPVTIGTAAVGQSGLSGRSRATSCRRPRRRSSSRPFPPAAAR